jgi:hypothetical protein
MTERLIRKNGGRKPSSAPISAIKVRVGSPMLAASAVASAGPTPVTGSGSMSAAARVVTPPVVPEFQLDHR